MYTVLIKDVDAVQTAYDTGSVTRTWEKVVNNVHPDTETLLSQNTRTPYDGYIAHHWYPQLSASKPEVLSIFRCRNVNAVTENGQQYTWSGGTVKQLAAAMMEASFQTTEIDLAHSNYVGEVGKRTHISGTIWNAYCERKYGWYHGNKRWYHVIRDEQKNVILHVGTTQLGDIGERVSILPIVKCHEDASGIKRTFIERPKRI